MKKLLLLDADVIIDLHSLGLFETIGKVYEIHVTKTVFQEAAYFKKEGKRFKINIRNLVRIIEEVNLETLKTVQKGLKRLVSVLIRAKWNPFPA